MKATVFSARWFCLLNWLMNHICVLKVFAVVKISPMHLLLGLNLRNNQPTEGCLVWSRVGQRGDFSQ